MRVAILSEGGAVENIIVAPEDFAPGPSMRVLDAASRAAPGWKWAAGVFLPPSDLAPVPEKVSDLQFRLALNALGLREQAETVIERGTQGLRDYWGRALEIHRTHPLIAEAGGALGKSDAEIDALFRLAAEM